VKGRFITFEGPEGAGKSSHVAMLSSHLAERDIEVVLVREPGGTSVGEAVRDVLQHKAECHDMVSEAELLLFEASRAQLVRRVILPALNEGKWVISDRFMDSTTVYQGYGRGIDIEKIKILNNFATGGLEPDLTILLDIDLDESISRLKKRGNTGNDRIENEARDFHERVRNGYLDLAEKNPQRIVVVDASGDLNEVDRKIIEIIDKRLK